MLPLPLPLLSTRLVERTHRISRERQPKPPNPTLTQPTHRGAKTAMTLALAQPSLISDLVSVDNAPIDATLNRTFATYIRGMRHIEEAGVTRQSEADAILTSYEPDVGIRQFLLGNMHRIAMAPDANDEMRTEHKKNVVKFRIPLDILAKSLDHMGDFPFRNPDEARFEKPALFVRGTHSKYVPDEAIPAIGRFFPRFSLVDIEAGHWVISEKPAEFLKGEGFFLLLSFLVPHATVYICKSKHETD